MRRATFAAILAAALIAVGCSKEGNPILPTDPRTTDPDKLTLNVTSTHAQLETGSTTGETLKITARKADGSLPSDGTQITVNTSLGNFGVDSAGKPIQLITRTLFGGAADVVFFAGSTSGVANIMVQAGTSVASLNLMLVDPPPPPVADFTFAQSGLSVLFTDMSTGSPASYRWRFGDGRESTERNPTHTYQLAGTYTVSLEVSNSGGSSGKNKFIDVSLGEPPQAAFAFTTDGLQVNFVDRSKNDPTSWSWIFGDNTTSNLRNPIHTYGAAGTYTVVLLAANAAGSNSTSDVVQVEAGTPPVAKFKATVTGKQVNFVDQSTGTPTSWLWNFGDNTTSSLPNPIHLYTTSGTYTVTLTVANAAGSNSASDAVKIDPVPPVADFAFTVTGHQANFVDRSTGNPSSWSWSFGDGGTSTQQNPIHIYPTAGSYTAMLTVTNADGSNSKSQVVVIEAGTAPKAAFTFTKNNLQVAFADQSSGAPTTWLWDFGDSSGLSTQQNPVHTYAAAGSYTVTLSVSNANGTNSVSQAVSVTSSP